MRKAMQFVVTALVLALVFSAGIAAAQTGQKGQGMRQGYGYGQMSPEQMQEMRNIQAEYADKMYELHSQLYAKQQELAAAMTGEQVDADRAKSLVDEINDLRGEMLTMQTEMQIEMRQKGLMPSYGGYGMGHGMMHGSRGMGPGMMGPGMMHGGQGMGPGMMGPGMMHGGRGMGPGMMGPGMMHGGRGMGPGMGQGMMYGCPYQRNY